MLYKEYKKDGNVAVVEIDESNGEVSDIQVTHNITNTNMGSVDAPNLDPVAYPINSGERSFAKYHRFHVTDLGGSSNVQNLRIWRTGDLGGDEDSLLCNLKTENYNQNNYAEPTRAEISGVVNDMPTEETDSANLGIAGALNGSLTAVGFSDYFVHQLVVNAGAVGGSTYVLNYQYDELA